MIMGIVIIEISVETETIDAERGVSCPNLSENIVVTAAIGDAAEITREIIIVPEIPNAKAPKSIIRGKIISFKIIAR